MQTLNQLPEEGQKAIARSLGYMGKKDGFPAYLMSNPSVAQEYTAMENAFRKHQEFTQMNKKPQMAEGGYMMDRFAQNQQQEMVGGYTPPPKQSFANGGLQVGTQAVVYGPDGQQYGNSMIAERAGVTDYGYTQPSTVEQFPIAEFQPTNVGNTRMSTVPSGGTAMQTLPTQPVPTQTFQPNSTIGDVSAQMLATPGLPSGAKVQPVGIVPTAQQDIGAGVGQVSGQVALPSAQAATATTVQPTVQDANVMTAEKASGVVNTALQQTQAAQGTLGTNAQVTAQQQVASSVSELNAAQGVATQMTNPVQRQVQSGELVTPVANAQTASTYAEQIQAATATPTDKATVQGQLATLTANFDASNPPAWAAGSLRAVQAQMTARGLGASSIAGQALVQAALESALPIAQADAQVQASFESANLSNRQQRAMLAAQQRAQFIGQEFDQGFQARVQNAAKIGDIANMNFTAEQNIALENSRAANTMDLNNLSNKQAMVLAEASALSNMDMSNLSNRQQSAVQNAQSFMQMDMANLSNTQQANMFNAQQRIQSLFTDQASENASRQFNATSQNQVDQFFSQLGQQANQFNATQVNAQEQFNAGQTNTIERFNAELNNQRDQFNAQNQTVIAQSNANWRRQIATADTTATNRANELNAQALLGLSNQAYNNLWQYYGDTMEWAWTSAENERSRVIELAKSQLAADSAFDIQNLKNDYNSSTGFGKLIGTFLTAGKGSVAGSLIGGLF